MDDTAVLMAEWKHAADIALTSVGQSDHAQNVAYRDELGAKLSLCRGCDCPKQRCDSYGSGRKCCPDCRHPAP
jgi:hypothetical protein